MTDRKIRVACEHLSVVNISVLSVQDLTVPGSLSNGKIVPARRPPKEILR
jgi:hypothetical protein